MKYIIIGYLFVSICATVLIFLFWDEIGKIVKKFLERIGDTGERKS